MRILYCNKYNFGFSGTETYLFETMELMRARGHEVALFAMADPRGQSTEYDHHFVSYTNFKLGGSVISKARLGFRAIYSIEARHKIRQMIADFRPDVAHVRNIYHQLSPSILWELKAQGVPVLYHVNDFKLLCPSYNMVSAGKACERCKGGRFYNVVREGCYAGGTTASVVLAAEAYVHRWMRTYQQCVDLIVAPSQFVKGKFLENGWDPSRIKVLPHHQALPLNSTPHPGPQAPVLYFGRLSSEKGVADLIRAMKLLSEIRLVVAGDGPQRADLEKITSMLGLTNVTFTGHLEKRDLEKLISSAQFTIFPSYAYETMGKSILESYAQGRAVVASDLGSRRELIQEGKTGLLYPVGDVQQLAAAIVRLQRNPTLSREMGEAGRKLVRERHSQEEHLRKLESLYDTLRVRCALRQPPPRIRVAYIGGRGVGGKYSGIETYYEETGKRLASMGVEVTAYCRSYFTPAGAQADGIRVVRIPTYRSKHLETLLHTFLSTIHACFSRNDIVHYHCIGPSIFSFLPRVFGKRTVVTVQGLDWQRSKWGWVARRCLRFAEWTSARFPNQTIVVSRVLRDYYQANYPRAASLVRNGTDVRECEGNGHLGALGISPNKYVLFLGRFSPGKNCHLLIEAFEKLSTPFKLVLAGGSSHTDEYSARLRTHASDRVIVLDWLSGDALHEVLANAALFVLPSDIEGLSLALLDAMASGVCVLASDTPENLEALEDTGFTFRRGDAADLQRMLTYLLDNDQLRANFGTRARERVHENFLWEDVVNELAEIYARILRRDEKLATVAPRLSPPKASVVEIGRASTNHKGQEGTGSESASHQEMARSVRSGR
jgi:glycosyltransferase involved in cell wall biosynthesis